MAKVQEITFNFANDIQSKFTDYMSGRIDEVINFSQGGIVPSNSTGGKKMIFTAKEAQAVAKLEMVKGAENTVTSIMNRAQNNAKGRQAQETADNHVALVAKEFLEEQGYTVKTEAMTVSVENQPVERTLLTATW